MIPSINRWLSSWPGIFLVTFVSLALFIPFWFLNDPGTFWHIRTGEWMIEHLQVLRSDPFSQSESTWVPTQWLAEILMAGTYRIGGFASIKIFTSLIIAGWISILAHRWFLAGMHPLLVWFLAGLVLKIGALHFLARPLLINYLGMTLLAFFILDFEKQRAKVSTLFWSFPLAVFWANCHGGYLAGISILGLAILIWTTQYLLSKGPISDFKNLLSLGAAGIFWLLAPCISPFGIGMYAEWLKIWFKLDLSSYIIEHSAPKLLDFYMLGAYAVFAAVTMFFFMSPKGGEYPGITSSIWAWFFLATKRARNAPIFISIAAVMFEEIWLDLVNSKKIREDWIIRQPTKPSQKMKAGLLLIVGGFIISSILGWHQVQLDPKKWPLDLIEPMQQMALEYGPDTKIYNELNDGGFLIFYSPKWKVFQDDRCEIHAFRDERNDGSWIPNIMNLEKNTPEQLLLELQTRGIKIAIVPKDSPLGKLLQATNQPLSMVFSGQTHAIWLLN
ncbi:MAG: hypothetical protein EBT92_15605 [Planctomycetes bacterium]|nr:hypothetical protein [Planctomycetota bacterium]NBY02754.1 hypothetical protein [Planctomycetota bacterium]